jgi:long-chain acyl-CoA synthetase
MVLYDAASSPQREPHVTTQIRVQPPLDDRGTLIDLFLRNVKQFPGVSAIVDGATRMTWGQYGSAAMAAALGLHDLGIAVGDVVGLQQINRHEHVVADTAALMLRAIPTSFYNTLAPDQLSYVAGDCRARAVIVDADKLDVWLKLRDELDELDHIIVHDTGEVPAGVVRWSDVVARGQALLDDGGEKILDQILADRHPSDPATIIYTSGTTGPPKGVVLINEGLRFTAEGGAALIIAGVQRIGGDLFPEWITDGVVHIPPGQPGLSYLPLAHVAERYISHYSAYVLGHEITYVRDLATLPQILPTVRPFVFPAVPRVWEKFYGAIVTKLEAEPNDRKRKLGQLAVEVARTKGQALTEHRRADVKTELLHLLFEKIIYPKIRAAMGLDRCLMGFSGAAPIQADLLYVFTGFGIPISEVYGMTESSTLITMTPIGRPRVGTVGVPLAGTEVKIADDGEILARGVNITPGYLNRPEATAEAIDTDGWLHTGDLGAFDDAGYLKIVGRKKELIITAAGKNLSPNNIEESIKSTSPIIGQVLAYGDQKPYIAALVVLDPDATPAWCKSHGVSATTVAEAAEHPQVLAEIERAMGEGNATLARVEQVKRWTVLASEWTPESGELTPTMKLKRQVIHEQYADHIEELFA